MLKAFLLSAILTVFASSATAQTLLTIEHDGVSVEYNLEELEALPQTKYVSGNPFFDGEQEYSGPLLREIFKDAGLLDQDSVSMRAINEYTINFPVADASKFDVVVATRINGKLLSVRDKGPLWVMYPFSHHEELSDPVYKGRTVWQLVKITTQ